MRWPKSLQIAQPDLRVKAWEYQSCLANAELLFCRFRQHGPKVGGDFEIAAFIEVALIEPTYIDWIAPTFVISLAGLPAISVPCGLSEAGLPIGLQVIGPRWGEERALAVAAVVESRHPIGRPPLQA